MATCLRTATLDPAERRVGCALHLPDWLDISNGLRSWFSPGLRIVPPVADLNYPLKLRSSASVRRLSEKPMRPLEFGWYPPTYGDTTADGF
jgi:hypothetical protein